MCALYMMIEYWLFQSCCTAEWQQQINFTSIVQTELVELKHAQKCSDEVSHCWIIINIRQSVSSAQIKYYYKYILEFWLLTGWNKSRDQSEFTDVERNKIIQKWNKREKIKHK